MNTYLAIITTILVVTQVVRVTQNAIQLKRQNKMIKKQLEAVEEVTTKDIQRQRQLHILALAYLERKMSRMMEE